MSANTKQPVASMLTLDGFVLPMDRVAPVVALTLGDRCDSCSAAALVRAVQDGSVLLFCGNHGKRHVAALVEQGWSIDDQTYRAFGGVTAPARGNEPEAPSQDHIIHPNH